MEKLPFVENIENNKKIRLFSQNIKSDELKWHFDDENRIVKILNKTNWKFQMDNDIPITLIEGKEYFIPKGVYHRVIKGTGNLKIEITVT